MHSSLPSSWALPCWALPAEKFGFGHSQFTFKGDAGMHGSETHVHVEVDAQLAVQQLFLPDVGLQLHHSVQTLRQQ